MLALGWILKEHTEACVEGKRAKGMPKILVMDDDEHVRVLLKDVLQEHGYEVHEAADGWEGTKLFCDRPIDLVIVDLFMPKKDGVETIIEIRRTRPDVKTIVISEGGLLGELEFLTHARTFGADRSFAKTFRLGEFVDSVRDLVDPSHHVA
jgi:DNA-binding response OmpR family regulator